MKRSELKDYAAAHWTGVCNAIAPSFTADLRHLNEAAIRHDVRQNIAHGFWGALLVSECGTTLDEYRQFMSIAADEARGRQRLLVAGVFDTVEDTVAMIDAAAGIGMEGVLLGQPNSFYPTSSDQLFDYLSHVAGTTSLPVVMFMTTQMNLGRFDPSGYPLDVVVRMAEFENVVAVKYEVGRPGLAGDYQAWRALKGKRVLFSDPLEAHSPLTVELLGQQWMGTSNYEYWGPAVPQYFELLRQGQFDEAMEIYWRINPARQTRVNLQSTVTGSNFIHRYLWKYQAWLQGYNGGPMRQPVAKLNDTQMRTARDGLVRSGFELPDEGIAAFYVGRNPA